MIRHVVMFKFKDDVAGHDRRGFIDQLHGLSAAIPQIKQLEIGENFAQSERACDVVLLVDVESKDDLQIYADHPDHQPVKQRAGEICSASYVVDYVLPV